MTTDNLALWNRREKTNPKYTKPVQFGGREFTSIDAQHVMQNLTEEFGPCGVGWGYSTECSVQQTLGDPKIVIAIVSVRFWYVWEEKPRNFGPITVAERLVTDRGKFDGDAFKKCETNAITKAASRLGFHADVFLGKFDDDKYVEEVSGYYADEELVERARVAIFKCNTSDELDACLNRARDLVKRGMSSEAFEAIKLAYHERKEMVDAAQGQSEG